MTWYMGIDELGRPNGWDTVPWGCAIAVSDAVRTIHEVHPDYRWDGTTLVEHVQPTPPAPEPYIPTQLTRRQAKLILLQYGLLDAVEAVVATLPRAAQIEYADALSFERSNPLMKLVAETAGLTTEQVDAMFVAGSAL